MITKYCTDCKIEKPLSEFPIDRSASSGYKSYCKECNRLRSKRHKEEVAKRTKIVPASKVCARCGKGKPSNQFSKSRTSTDGLTSFCKECQHDDYQRYKAKPKTTPDSKVCPKCGIHKGASAFGPSVRTKDGLQYWCVSCRKENYLGNRERFLEGFREYSRKNRIWRRGYNRRYREENLERLRDAQREYFLTRVKGTERYYAYNRIKNARRRSRNAAVANDWSPTHEKFLYDVQKSKCARCGQHMTRGNRKLTTNMTVDHIVPLSMGGGLTLRNAQLLCQSCNSSKNAKIEDYCTWVPKGDRIFLLADLTKPSKFWDGFNSLG